jgi:hypothetical protein
MPWMNTSLAVLEAMGGIAGRARKAVLAAVHKYSILYKSCALELDAAQLSAGCRSASL